MRTLAGRMLFGPAYFCFFSWREKVMAIRDRHWRRLRPLLWHLPALAVVLYWVLVVCDIPFWAYVALFAYPGTSLTFGFATSTRWTLFGSPGVTAIAFISQLLKSGQYHPR